MTMPVTRSGRPNTSGTRGGQAGQSPLPLAEEQYSKDNEQKFRRQLMDILSPLQQQLAATASGLTGLVASAVENDSGVAGDAVSDALDTLLASLSTKQPLDADLTALAAISTAAYGRSLLALANATALAAEVDSFFLTPTEGNAAYQPLDGDLTAIAALATTATGRALLAIASAAAGFDSLAPTTTRGDLIVRGASSNSRLALGTTRQVLESDGTDAVWASRGVATLVSPTALPSAASVDIMSIPADFSYLLLHIAGISCDTATRAAMVQASTNNGSSFDATAGNYIGYYAQATPTFVNNGLASLVGGPAVAAAVTQNISLKLLAYQGGGHPMAQSTITGGGTDFTSSVHYIGSTSAINALRILWNASGNFDAGTYALYGIK